MSVASEIEERAALLLARLDAEPESPAVRAEVESWLSGDPRHEVAYLRLRAAWRHVDRIAALGSYENARRQMAGTAQATTRNWHRWSAAAAAILAAIALIAWWQATRVTSRVIAFSTPVGGYMRQTLADGSTLELNTQTTVEVVFDSGERGIRLLRGEARFHVAKDPQRPFVVAAGADRVKAVGTDFSVRTRAEQTDVWVAEGIVSLEDSIHRGGAADSARVRAGQGAVMTSTGVSISDLPQGAVAARLAWGRGLLIFSGEPLDLVAQELNRYNTLQIRVTDSAAASLRIAGTFGATNAVGFVRLLEQGFPVSIARQGDTVTVSSRNGAGGNDPQLP
jgi:transmembrane sensor